MNVHELKITLKLSDTDFAGLCQASESIADMNMSEVADLLAKPSRTQLDGGIALLALERQSVIGKHYRDNPPAVLSQIDRIEAMEKEQQATNLKATEHIKQIGDDAIIFHLRTGLNPARFESTLDLRYSTTSPVDSEGESIPFNTWKDDHLRTVFGVGKDLE
jgi:hypothetical protein